MPSVMEATKSFAFIPLMSLIFWIPAIARDCSLLLFASQEVSKRCESPARPQAHGAMFDPEARAARPDGSSEVRHQDRIRIGANSAPACFDVFVFHLGKVGIETQTKGIPLDIGDECLSAHESRWVTPYGVGSLRVVNPQHPPVSVR